MIDGLAEMLPARVVEFTAGGRPWRMGELTARDYAEMSAFLLSKRPHPLDSLKGHLAGLEKEQQAMLLNKAFEACRRAPIVSQFELFDWLYSPEGTIYATWLCLRKHHPSITLAEVENLFSPMSPAIVEKFQGLIDQLSGLPNENPSPAVGTTAPTPTA